MSKNNKRKRNKDNESDNEEEDNSSKKPNNNINPESSESSSSSDNELEESNNDSNIPIIFILLDAINNTCDTDDAKNNKKTFSPHTPDYPPSDDYNMNEENNDCTDCNNTNEDKNEDCEDKDKSNNKSHRNTYNFRNSRKQDSSIKNDNDQIDAFFTNLLNEPLKNKRGGPSHRRRRHSIDDFTDYFTESDILLPINKSIKTLKDLIELGKTYDKYDKNRYVINLRALNKCVKPLEELDSMIGMKNIKEMIIDLIFYRLQNLGDSQNELWHLVIQGSPGSGKTEVSKIIGKLYYGLGITTKDKFTLVKRSDLIGKYLGHTAKMTQDAFDDARGGILFIDEAYSLGNPEGRDSFSKECIDTINQNLTENRETVVFIAGYKEQLEESFFSYNPGLNRRFKMRMNVDKYNAGELREIFLKKLNESKWTILNDDNAKEIPLTFFEKNMGLFKYNGGDMENLWHFTKIVHARRIFGQSNDIVKKITYKDLENSLKMYNDNDEFKSRSDTISKYILDTMYC